MEWPEISDCSNGLLTVFPALSTRIYSGLNCAVTVFSKARIPAGSARLSGRGVQSWPMPRAVRARTLARRLAITTLLRPTGPDRWRLPCPGRTRRRSQALSGRQAPQPAAIYRRSCHADFMPVRILNVALRWSDQWASALSARDQGRIFGIGGWHAVGLAFRNAITASKEATVA